jgi:hypothetical protein
MKVEFVVTSQKKGLFDVSRVMDFVSRHDLGIPSLFV